MLSYMATLPRKESAGAPRPTKEAALLTRGRFHAARPLLVRRKPLDSLSRTNLFALATFWTTMGSDSCHDKHDSVTPKSSALPSGQEGQSTVKEDPVSSGSCCEGSCSCDGQWIDSIFNFWSLIRGSEQCLSQLARAICADDDDHIHSLTHKSAESEEKAPGGNTSQDDSCSCCGQYYW